jgi:hypothetical protein
MNRIYFDRNSCEYFGIPYFDAHTWSCAKDAYKRCMGNKLDNEHKSILRKHRQIMTLQRAEYDGPGWYIIQSSHA